MTKGTLRQGASRSRRPRHGGPIKPARVEERTRVVELVEQFKSTSFQSRNIYKAYDVLKRMQTDPARPTIFLGLAGAMVPAGMKGALMDMIKHKMVDVIVSTGANLTHDLVEALGALHLVGTPETDDLELRKRGYCRIYDTYLDERGFYAEEDLVLSVLSQMKAREYSSREFFEDLGRRLSPRNSLVALAARKGVPIYCPALCDSDIGIALTLHHAKNLERPAPSINPIRDNFEIYQIYRRSNRTGAILIGGGVPRNYIQQLSVICEALRVDRADRNSQMGHDYGVLITTDSPQWGGLSGCTFSESISWGKYSVGSRTATVYADATIVLPILVGALIQKLAGKLASKPRLELMWDGAKLRRIARRTD